MKIESETQNCSYEQPWLIEWAADSVVKLRIEIDRIPTSQSKRVVAEPVKQLIQSELSKFSWIISGGVYIEFNWFLHAVARQETDKTGDLDNISKPVLDALTGPNGIIVDDSQVRALYTTWESRNEVLPYNVLYIQVKFNNDYALQKKNLYFIRYANPICTPVNIDFTNVKELIGIKLLIKTRLGTRKLAGKIKGKGANVDRYLVYSEYDYHITRLQDFPNTQKLSLEEFNKKCLDAGLSWSTLRSEYTTVKKLIASQGN